MTGPQYPPDAVRNVTRAACHHPGRPTDTRTRRPASPATRRPAAPLSVLPALAAVLLPAAVGSQPGALPHPEPAPALRAGVSAGPGIPVPVAAASNSATRPPSDWGSHSPREPEHPAEVKDRRHKPAADNHLPLVGDSSRSSVRIPRQLRRPRPDEQVVLGSTRRRQQQQRRAHRPPLRSSIPSPLNGRG